MADNDQNGRRLTQNGHPNDPRLKSQPHVNSSAHPLSRNLNVPPPPMMTIPQVLMPPPPPPPPPAPEPTPSTSRGLSSNPPVLPPMFDASRPPPPLPAYIRENGKHKMLASASVAAGPSKIKKSDHSKACSGLCENCVQRQIRIDIYKKEMEQLLAEDEKRDLAYKKKMQAIENGKQLIKSCYSEELYHFINEYVEEIPDFFEGNDFISERSSTSSSVTSKFSRQILLQLMKLMARNISDTEPSLEESLLPALRLVSPGRRASVREPGAGELAAALAAALSPAPAASAPTPPAPAPAPAAPAPAPAAAAAAPAPAMPVEWPPGFPPPTVPPPGYPNVPPPPRAHYPSQYNYFPYNQ